MIVRVFNSLRLTGQLEGQMLTELDVLALSARTYPTALAMSASRRFIDGDALELASKPIGRGRAILRRLSARDRDPVRIAVEHEYTIADRRSAVITASRDRSRENNVAERS